MSIVNNLPALIGGILFTGMGILKIYGIKQRLVQGNTNSAKELLCGT